MTRVSETAEHWFGLCRKPPALHTRQMSTGILPEFAVEGVPSGGCGGPGAILRGIGAAFSGMRTLNRNRQLFWFTLLAGFVLAANAIGHAAHYSITRYLQPTHFSAGDGPGSLSGLPLSYFGSSVLDFFIAFATLFCLVLLLAGFFLSIASKKEGSASFFEGIAGTKKYKNALFRWSFVLALAGMLLDRIWVYFALAGFLPRERGFCLDFGLTSLITQFPFNWTLDWGMLTEVPGYGGRSLVLLIYPFGFLETLHFSAITLLLVVMTPLVVPLIVLEQKNLGGAVAGSFALMKKIWVELAACAAFLGIVVAGVFFLHLLVQAASGMVSPYNTAVIHPPGAWIALALLYNIVLVTVAFIAATVAGIAALDLYISARTGQLPGSP